jgi:protein-disulfide isomerase
VTVGKQARETARERRIARETVQRRTKRRNQIIGSAGVMVIVGLVIAIVVALVSAAGGNDKDSEATGKPRVTPAIATAGGALAIGEATAPVRLEIYLDYMCPYCGRFEEANSREIDRMVADGTVHIELYTMSFLDKMSQGARYSTRAANAVATVADGAPDKVLAFNAVLFADQPAEGTDGLSDDEIARLASGSGIPPEIIARFPDRTFEPWVAASTSTVFDSGVTGTPTVKINGALFRGDLYTSGPLTQAVMAAKGQP